MKQRYQDRIDNYLLKQMTDNEMLAFEEDLEKDEELRDQYEFTKIVKAAIEDKQKKKEEIETDIRKWERAYQLRKKPKRHIIYWISGIAALFIVFFFLFKPYPTQYSYIRVPSKTQNSDSSLDSETSESNTIQEYNGYETIEDLLAYGNFDIALDKIQETKEELKHEMELIKEGKRGISRTTAANNKAKKERSKEKRKESSTSGKLNNLQERLDLLQWQEAQALIGLGRYSEAIILFDSIRHSNSEWKTQADSLYIVIKQKDIAQ